MPYILNGNKNFTNLELYFLNMKTAFLKSLKIYALLVTIILLSYLPIPLILLPIQPKLVMLLIFFFSITEETRPNLAFLILLGLLNDLLGHNIIGITSLCYVLISLIASSNKKALNEQRFNIVWLTLTFSLFLALIIKFLATIMIYDKTLSLISPLELLFSALLYPTLHYILIKRIHWFR